MEKTYSLKKNKVVGFGGSHYTKDNMTDAVAFEMVRSNRSNAAHFENPEQLLKDYDAVAKPLTESLKGVASANKVPKEEKSATAPVADAAENITVSVTEKNPNAPIQKFSERLAEEKSKKDKKKKK